MKKVSKRSATFINFNAKAMELFGTSKITRDQAVSKGLVFYWTGIECDRGHLTFRYVSNRMCRQCKQEDNSLSNYGDDHAGLDTKNAIDDLEYRLELKRLEKEFDYDI